MREKITNILGGELIFEINYPPEIKDKEQIQTNRAKELILKLLEGEFTPSKEDLTL